MWHTSICASPSVPLGDAQILGGSQFGLMTANGSLSGRLAHNRWWWPLMKTFKLTSNWWKWQWSGGWLLIAIICVIVAKPWGGRHVGSVGAAVRRCGSGLENQTTDGVNHCLPALESKLGSKCAFRWEEAGQAGWRRSLFTCARVWEQLLQNDLEILYNHLQMCFFCISSALPLAPACCSSVLHEEDSGTQEYLPSSMPEVHNCMTTQPGPNNTQTVLSPQRINPFSVKLKVVRRHSRECYRCIWLKRITATAHHAQIKLFYWLLGMCGSLQHCCCPEENSVCRMQLLAFARLPPDCRHNSQQDLLCFHRKCFSPLFQEGLEDKDVMPPKKVRPPLGIWFPFVFIIQLKFFLKNMEAT